MEMAGEYVSTLGAMSVRMWQQWPSPRQPRRISRTGRAEVNRTELLQARYRNSRWQDRLGGSSSSGEFELVRATPRRRKRSKPSQSDVELREQLAELTKHVTRYPALEVWD